MPPWCAADEVYGRSSELRAFAETHGIGYVLRVGCAFQADLAPGTRLRAEAVVATYLTSNKHQRRWQTCSVAGSKGERAYAWAWVATTSPCHYLLIRKHHTTGELAYHYCYVPPGRPVTLRTLVQVACLRWPVEIAHQGDKAPIQASQRWHVERTHAWQNAFNRLQRCYERREQVIDAFFDLADAIITVRSMIRKAWTTHRWDSRPARRP